MSGRPYEQLWRDFERRRDEGEPADRALALALHAAFDRSLAAEDARVAIERKSARYAEDGETTRAAALHLALMESADEERIAAEKEKLYARAASRVETLMKQGVPYELALRRSHEELGIV